MLALFRSSLVRNAGKLFTANVVAQTIGLIVYPILTRTYAPEDFALLSLFSSIAGVLALVATAEYQYAVVLPKNDRQAAALIHVCMLLLSGLFGLLCLTIPFARPIAALFNTPQLANWWWMMPLIVLCMGLWNMLNYWYIRRKEFMRISGYQITQSVFSASGKIGLGLLGWLQGGLIIATVFAPLLSLVISGTLAWRKHLRLLLHPRSSEMRLMAREYANFPKFNLPRSLVNSIGVALPIWLLTPNFGLAEIGQLSIAMMAAIVPLSIIAKACYQVLFQRVAEQVQNRQSFHSVLWRFGLWCTGALAVGLTGVYIFVPQLVTLFFGAEWQEAGTIIRTLYPYIVLTPICGSLCFLPDVFAKQKTALFLEVGYVVAMAAALLVGIHLADFMTAVSLFAWARFAYLAIQLIWFASLAHTYHRSLADN